MRRKLPPEGRVIVRAIRQHRFANDLSARVARRIVAARDAVARALALQDPTVVSPGRRAMRVASLQRKIDVILQTAYREIHTMVRDDLVAVARGSATYTAAEIAKRVESVTASLPDVSVPSAAVFRSLVTTDPMQGAVLRDWWGKQSLDTRTRVKRAIVQGVARNDPLPVIVRALVGRGRMGLGGVFTGSIHAARAVVRTAVNHYANQAARLTYEENAKLIELVEIVATLDERTTEICAALDGKTFAVGSADESYPPYHFSCRTTTVPLVKGWTRSPRVTYPEWFMAQDQAVQDRILGPARAALIRSGAVTFSDLVRSDGARATLAQLHAA